MADIGTEPLQNQGEHKHKNDMYGDVDNPAAIEDAPPAVPAATVVLLRDTDQGPEVLMLRKNSRIAFGGMWVFPGGRIDPEDYPEDGNKDIGARNAAAREAQEEAGVELDPQDFVWFAHWTPPPSTPKRFATWFFAARAGEDAISIDGGEIEDHRWIRPGDALAKHAEGEIDLVPPTWVTLYHLSQRQSVAAVLGQLRRPRGAGVPNARRQARRRRPRRHVDWRCRLRRLERGPGRPTPPPEHAGWRLLVREHGGGLLTGGSFPPALVVKLCSRCSLRQHNQA